MRNHKTLFVVSILMTGAAAQAVTIYDTVTAAPGFGIYTGPGNRLSGDNFAPPQLGPGQHWRITGYTATAFASDAGLYSNMMVDINFYNFVDLFAVTFEPAFGELAGSAHTDLPGTFNASGAGSGFSYTVNGLSIDLNEEPTNPTTGYGFEVRWSSTGPGTLSSGYADIGSSVVDSFWSNGMYIDFIPDDVLDNLEFTNFDGWTNGNFAIQIRATAVPEPATLAVLGVGALALLRRRKKA
ncbi:MAG: PEP-CTERM sorting domain-containing protein [Fimbriimonadaceae bacterium]|nr:PEP-CTERM sorting domain-containing protein [Fimbriimonadaceae bacterium]